MKLLACLIHVSGEKVGRLSLRAAEPKPRAAAWREAISFTPAQKALEIASLRLAMTCKRASLKTFMNNAG